MRKGNSKRASRGRHDHRFGQKLKQNIVTAGAESFFHANFASALGDRDQHDIHQSDPPNPQRYGTDEGQKNFQRHGYNTELRELLLRVEDEDRSLVVGLEAVCGSESVPNRLIKPVVVESGRIHPDAVKVVIVLEHIHGVEGKVDDAVVIVVAFLHTGRANSDDLKRYAVDADGFTDRGHSREKLVARLRSDDRIETVLHVVGIVQEASLGDVEIPDRLDRRIESHHGESEGAIIVLYRGIFLRHANDVAA